MTVCVLLVTLDVAVRSLIGKKVSMQHHMTFFALILQTFDVNGIKHGSLPQL